MTLGVAVDSRSFEPGLRAASKESRSRPKGSNSRMFRLSTLSLVPRSPGPFQPLSDLAFHAPFSAFRPTGNGAKIYTPEFLPVGCANVVSKMRTLEVVSVVFHYLVPKKIGGCFLKNKNLCSDKA